MPDTGISGEQRFDEIGDLARALGIFKAISKIRIEEQGDEERRAAEHERQRNEAEKRGPDRHDQRACGDDSWRQPGPVLRAAGSQLDR